jgi:hypothetical protein
MHKKKNEIVIEALTSWDKEHKQARLAKNYAREGGRRTY